MVLMPEPDGPPLFAVQPRFHLPTALRTVPKAALAGLAVGAATAPLLLGGFSPIWLALVWMLGAAVAIAAARILYLRLYLPQSWYSIHPDRIHVRREGLVRSDENRPFQGVVGIELERTDAQKAAGVGDLRFIRERLENGRPVRSNERLVNVPDPDGFLAFVRPLVAKAQDPRRVQAPK